jgi:streptomycin 6-kinase
MSINFKNNITQIYGQSGITWLDNLPVMVKNLAQKYHLQDLTPVNNLSYNYVLSGFKLTIPIILKIGLDVQAMQREAKALKAFLGFGAVNLLDQSDGILLLERAIPGDSLQSYFPKKDDMAGQIVCDVIKKLHQAPLPAAGFPHVADWLQTLDKAWNIPSQHLQKARLLCDHLLTTSAAPVLLHGDLHHDNILRSGNDWVVIDPKGVIGEPAYEVAAFIRNPFPELLSHNDSMQIIRSRINLFAETLNLDDQRILDWCFVQAVLAWAWALEDRICSENFRKLTAVFT